VIIPGNEMKWDRIHPKKVGRYKGKILSWDVVNESIKPMATERASGLKLLGLNFWNWHFN